MNDDHYVAKDSERLEGRYTNYFRVGFNAFEFLLDFGQHYGDDTRERLHTRLITGPAYAKTLLTLLEDSIRRYQQAYGVIGDVDSGEPD